MMDMEPAVKILSDKCIGCEACLPACPFGSIEISSAGKAEITGPCRACMACAMECPQEAIVEAEPRSYDMPQGPGAGWWTGHGGRR